MEITEEIINQSRKVLDNIQKSLESTAVDIQDFHVRINGNADQGYVQCAVLTEDHMVSLASFSVETYFTNRKLTFRVSVTCTICNGLSEALLQFRALTHVMGMSEMVDRVHVSPWNTAQ